MKKIIALVLALALCLTAFGVMAEGENKVKVGFIHVPYAPEQGEPSLAVEHTASALEAAIRVC